MVFKRTLFLFYIAVCKEALEVHNYALTVDTFFFFLSQRNLLSLFFFFLYIPHWLCTFPSHVWNAWLNDLSACLGLMRWAARPKLLMLLLLLKLSHFSFWTRVHVSMGESLAPEFRNLLNSLLLFFLVKCDSKPLFDYACSVGLLNAL